MPLCIIFYAAKKSMNYRNNILLIFSLAFYAWGEPVFVFLLIISAAVNFISGLSIKRFYGKSGAKIAAVFAVIFDVGMLGVFKYSGFVIENINSLTPLSLKVPDIRLPIGISFFTFQMISYVIDCMWEKVTVQKSFSKFLMYVSLFPQLVAGPIVRYSDIQNEIDFRKTSVDDLYCGITRLAFGLGKKVILADNLNIAVKALFGGDISDISVAGAWLGASLYALQIYFDFSGYSDMAIGLGRMFGFHFNENFNYPFICKDISNFWQRWHISLSSFFRDYLLYVPIFGKRRKYGGLFLVWFCTGLWHGASWNYVIWGLYFGLFIFLEKLVGKKRMRKIPILLRHIYSKLVITIGFGIFYFEDISSLGQFFKSLFGFGGEGLIDSRTKLVFVNNVYLISAALICALPFAVLLRKAAKKNYVLAYTMEIPKIAINLSLIIVSSIMLVDATNHPFLYFRF